MWIYILKTKDHVFEKFVEWKALIENARGKKLKTLCTDNGGEYTAIKFTAYLKKDGVCHEFTVPKNPQQNGVAERMKRTLIETVCLMLSDANLPKRLRHFRQRSTVVIKVQGETPFEAWMNERPDVSHLKVFDYVCYSHVSKDERQKFDTKVRKCIMLGYNTETKAHQLYDLNRRKFFSTVMWSSMKEKNRFMGTKSGNADTKCV